MSSKKKNRDGSRGGRSLHEERLARQGRTAKRRATIQQEIAQMKLERGCATCGYRGHPDALHYDHLPEHIKEGGISKMIRNQNWQQIKAEMEKCQVLCANCHAIVTAERRREAAAAKDRERDACQLSLHLG